MPLIHFFFHPKMEFLFQFHETISNYVVLLRWISVERNIKQSIVFIFEEFHGHIFLQGIMAWSYFSLHNLCFHISFSLFWFKDFFSSKSSTVAPAYSWGPLLITLESTSHALNICILYWCPGRWKRNNSVYFANQFFVLIELYVLNICVGTCCWVEFYCIVINLYVIFLTLNNCERYWTDINFFMFDFN